MSHIIYAAIMEKSVTFTGACANEIIPSINHSFVCKAKEGGDVRIGYIFWSIKYIFKISFTFRVLLTCNITQKAYQNK